MEGEFFAIAKLFKSNILLILNFILDSFIKW